MKFWKKLEYWKKGGVMGFIFGILNSTMILIAIIGNIRDQNHPILAKIMFNGITAAPLDLATWFVGLLGCVTSPCILNAMIVSLIPYTFIGIIIGFIIGKLKKKSV